MSAESDPAALYPDIAVEGSLATALQAAGASQGLSLTALSSESDPLRHASIASTAPGREPLIVSGWSWKRRWSITGLGRGRSSGPSLILISGNTDQLGAIAQVAAAWRDGMALAGIEQVAGFVELSGRYEPPDDDPRHVIASQWGYLRQEARAANWPTQVELIEAAYARPELRRLYAFTSHWTLRFATVLPPERPEVSDGEVSLNTVCIAASGEDGFTVRARWTELKDGEHTPGAIIANTNTADEAVYLALRSAACWG
ncbi:DUF6193 family natural product biosynthesis protein [Rhizocola hellebori]|nr:DUF6193 family natural product biosynthesis protein [Rhizocola hellebori]